MGFSFFGKLLAHSIDSELLAENKGVITWPASKWKIFWSQLFPNFLVFTHIYFLGLLSEVALQSFSEVIFTCFGYLVEIINKKTAGRNTVNVNFDFIVLVFTLRTKKGKITFIIFFVHLA
ncbi:hypothetical protein Cabther_B0720 [Chloracidobacterium thermophilum B]|uniref:Uncharacterized protein n=1 Tax=Chloracidobacterium thermophilum (strain B) TaxID=981222 RepID=G2LL41_CHLTF|nr:hypothetical protein Cabther_B0720 [Chloracidobacterium thermophilum B]